MDFLQSNVACMAAEQNKFLPPAAATAVVSFARSLREELPGDDLSVKMFAGTWQEQQRPALIIDLEVSL